MNRVLSITSALLLSILLPGAVISDEYTVGQKDKRFSIKKLTVKVGDTVHFTNEDPFAHNVYSLSNTKTFDLGSYFQGDSQAVIFDKSGKVPVECAIHPHMYMEITVDE